MQRFRDQLLLTLQGCGMTRRRDNMITSVPEQGFRRSTIPALSPY
jgi:hypothetical protein